MSVSGSLQQVSGGAAAALAGAIVTRAPDGHLEHFEWIGYVITGAALITLAFMYAIHRQVPDPAAKP